MKLFLAGCTAVLAVLAALAAGGCATSHSPVVRSAPVQLAATHAGEGPAWHASTRSLYFVGGDRITHYRPGGATEIVRDPAGGANGLLLDTEGRLVVCEAGNRRVTRTESHGGLTVLAEFHDGRRFNSPNDLAMDSHGRIYFTDPRYGSRTGMEQRDADGRLIEGVYRIDAPCRVQRILGPAEVDRPNGILVSPDDGHLFVADNNNSAGGTRKLWRFDLLADGTIRPGSRRLIFDWQTSRGPDGLKMDRAGRLFVAAGLNRANPPHETVAPCPAGIYVLSPAGRLLDFIPIPRDEVTNCAFGGDDLRTLFITAGGTLWSVGVKTPGRISFNPR